MIFMRDPPFVYVLSNMPHTTFPLTTFRKGLLMTITKPHEGLTQMRPIDLYEPADLLDPTERISQEIPPAEWEDSFIVTNISHEDLRLLDCGDESMTILELFERTATPSQRALVESKARDFDDDRIIVISGYTVIDGQHHVVAAHKAGRDVVALDLSQPAPEISVPEM